MPGRRRRNAAARILRGAALLAVTLCVAPAAGVAEVRVEVLETDPPGPATLGHWQEYYLRIGYQTDRPIRVRARAFFAGKPVPSMTSGSPRHEAGTGEAFYWIAYTDPRRVDSIVVTAEDDKTQKPLAETVLAVDLTWTGERGGAARVRPEWVTRMLAEEARRQRAATQAYMNRPVPWWQWVFFFGLMWSVPAYLVLQLIALWRWPGAWRLAAAIPAVPMAGVLVYTHMAYRAGSNLFPLVLLFTAPFALIYLIVLLGMRRARGRLVR
jgi:hypothetical protein